MSTDNPKSDSAPINNSPENKSSEGLDYVLESLNEETRSIIEEKALVDELERLKDDVEELLSGEGLIYREDIMENLDETYLLPDTSEYRLENYIDEFEFVINLSEAPRGSAYLYSKS